VEHYARIVSEKSLLRQLIREANRIIEHSYAAEDDATAILDQAETAILEVAQRRSGQDFFPIRDALIEAFDRIEYLYQTGSFREFLLVFGIWIAYQRFTTSGFHRGGSPSFHGQNQPVPKHCPTCSTKEGKPVALFSLEMSKEQLVQRLVVGRSTHPGQKLRTGDLDEEDWPRLVAAMGNLSEVPIFIDDSPVFTAMDIRAKTRRWFKNKGRGWLLWTICSLLPAMDGVATAVSRRSRTYRVHSRLWLGK
jgi:replicative DNA helicase